MLDNISMRKKVLLVAGARPNFIKIAPLMKAFEAHKEIFNVLLVHTGQHYDFQLSEIFFKDLNIPKPDICLNVGSASHAVQTAQIMSAFEKVILDEKPDWVVVVGDVNSTVACTLVAAKMHVKIAHVEAGLRSFDRTMPEEINRIVTDSIADHLFVSEESGVENLKNEGIASTKIHFVGNVMIDTLLSNMEKINKSDILGRLGLKPEAQTENEKLNRLYSVLTLHRPSNVDSPETLSEIYDIVETISRSIGIVYPVHPRTKKMMESHDFLSKFQKITNLKMVEPIGYIDFVKLVKESKFVLTDSGGIQEETTMLNIPCLTMRDNTERPVTIKKGTNCLVGRNKSKIKRCVGSIMNDTYKKGKIPKLWDGNTATLIVNSLREMHE